MTDDCWKLCQRITYYALYLITMACTSASQRAASSRMSCSGIKISFSHTIEFGINSYLPYTRQQDERLAPTNCAGTFQQLFHSVQRSINRNCCLIICPMHVFPMVS